MFSGEERERIRQRLIDAARSGPCLVAAVLADWTRTIVRDYGAAVLFDLPLGTTVYRVFLLPGALQVDLSFSPAADFGPRGPRFHLLFGEAIPHSQRLAPSLAQTLGLGVHHAVRGHVCIQRGRRCQAEYWLHEARDEALALACRRRGLEAREGRGFDRLPAEVRDSLAGAMVGNLSAAALRRALAVTTAALLEDAAVDIPDVVERVRPMLAEICRHRSC